MVVISKSGKPKNPLIPLQKMPYYFAHYLNMARHNAFLILEYISGLMFGDKKGKEEKVTVDEECLFNCKLLTYKYTRSDKLNMVVTLLLRHFPFLSYYQGIEQRGSMGELKTPYVCTILKSYLKILHSYRNEFSHYHCPQTEVESDIFDSFRYSELFEYSIAQAERRMVTLDKDHFDRLRKRVSSFEEEFKPLGIYFFINLFLERKYAFQFLGGVNEFKQESNKQNRALWEVFTQFCCQVPYPKLDSGSVALDMLNELNRCPSALYNVLSDEDKDSFKAIADFEQSEEVPEPVMKRHASRFPYFALKYFEETGVLDGISFHLQLGRRYAKESHEKVINGEVINHDLLKDMNTYGELSPYLLDEAYSFYEIENADKVHSYIPRYKIVGNRVGLVLRPSPFQAYRVVKKNQSPDAILSAHELHSLFFYNYLYTKGKLAKSPSLLIKDYISNFRRFLDDLKNGKISASSSHGIRKCRNRNDKEAAILNNLRNELETKLSHYGLKVKYLPDCCKEYLLSYKTDNIEYLVKKRLQKILQETNRRINLSCGIKEDGFRSSRINAKVGEMAQELAHDMVDMVPPKEVERENGIHLQKINDLEFNLLQKKLAYFSQYKDSLLSDFISLEDLGHPFLKEARQRLCSCKGLVDFYYIYYICKKQWLFKEMIVIDRKGRISLSKAVEILMEKYNYLMRIKIKSALDKDYSTVCVYLPVGLFDDKIVECLRADGLDVKPGDNASYCLKKYFGDKSQLYYKLPRYYSEYHNNDGKQDHPVECIKLKQKIKTEYESASEERQAELRQIAKRIRDNESEILRYQAEDRALYLMVTELMTDQEAMRQVDGIERIGFNIKDGILDAEYRMTLNIYGKKVYAHLPIKRYGEFRRFLKDRRLENLMRYYSKDSIGLGVIRSGETIGRGERFSRSTLVDELEWYDLRRIDLVKEIYDFEKFVYDHYFDELKETKKCEDSDKPEKAEPEHPIFFSHYYYLRTIEKCFPECFKKAIDGLEYPGNIKQYDQLRNSILHNQVPYEEWIAKSIKVMGGSPMKTGRIIEMISGIYRKMTECLKIMEGIES